VRLEEETGLFQVLIDELNLRFMGGKKFHSWFGFLDG